MCSFFLSCKAFDDKRTLSNILLQLAVMALAESNWGQATSLLLEAQVWCYSIVCYLEKIQYTPMLLSICEKV